MENKFTIYVHKKKDAMFLLHSLDDGQLKKLNLICFVGDFCYNVFYDFQSDIIVTTCYPYTIKISNNIRDTFIYVINSFYSDKTL